ncbi:MAG: hypothetical protein RJB66_229 [Pseudomonadota bacterium]|jgi:sugar phosphate permease
MPNLNRSRSLLLACIYLGYAGFMLIKTSIIAGGPALLNDASLGLTKSDWSSMLAFGTIGGIIGKFISGWSADRWGGKSTFTAGLLFASLGIAHFSHQSSAFAFAATYSAILLCNSSGWPSMAKLIGNWFEPHQYGRVWGLISTSSRVGTISATLIVSALLRNMEWRQMLLISATIGGSLFIIAYLFIKEYPAIPINRAMGNATKEAEANAVHPFAALNLNDAIKEFFRSRRFYLICASMMGLTILWDFINFVPVYLKESLKISASDAAMATSSLPLGSLVSVLLGGFIFDKLSRHLVAKIIGLYLFCTVLCITTLFLLPNISIADTSKMTITLACLFIFGFTVSPAYYLPMSIFSIAFGGPHSGFLIALIDVCGYGASVLFSFAAGRIFGGSESWAPFLIALIAVAIAAMTFTFWFLKNEAKLAEAKS